MRTLLVNHLLEPPHRVTGITRFLFGMLSGLLHATTDRYVLATAWSASRLPQSLRHPRLDVVTLPYSASSVVNVLRQNLVLPRLMRTTGAAAEFNSNPIGGFVGRWPRIATVHDLYYRLMPEAYSIRQRAVWRSVFPIVAQCSTAILVPSESTRADLRSFYPAAADKAFVVYEAPALIEAAEAHAPAGPAPVSGRYGIMVGNISPNKNAESIVAALAMLRDQGISVPLLHVGRDEIGAIATAQARLEKPVEIHALAGIDDGALRAAYAHAAFFINASHHEGFCLPLVEAQACGIPVIASDRSALPEVAGHGALLVDPTDPASIARAVEAVWTDAGLAHSLAERGRANVARFSWDRAGRELARKLDMLLAAPDGVPAKGAVRRFHA